MKTITFFDTLDELRELTEEPDTKKLWSIGFNLDDWDFGFVCDEEWVSERIWFCATPYYEWWLARQMDFYGFGFRHTKHNGRHYYLIYHHS
jgi:hypothetical protein